MREDSNMRGQLHDNNVLETAMALIASDTGVKQGTTQEATVISNTNGCLLD